MLSTCIRNVIQKPNLNRKNKAYTTTTVLNDRNDIIFKIFNIYQTGDFIVTLNIIKRMVNKK